MKQSTHHGTQIEPLSPSPDEVLTDLRSQIYPQPIVAGCLEDWRRDLASFCDGNPQLMFFLSHTFGAELAGLIGLPACGIHLHGPDSFAMSSVAKLVNSVSGSPRQIQTFDNSPAERKRLVRQHHQRFLVLDATGKRPQPSAEGGPTTAESALPETVCLSTGALPMEESMTQQDLAGVNHDRVGVINLPVHIGQGGLVSCLYGYSSARALLEAINEAVNWYYGVVGRMFAEDVRQEDPRELRRDFEWLRMGFLESLGLSEDSVLQRQVASEFALCAYAGGLATMFSLTFWSLDKPLIVARQMYCLWAENQGLSAG